jgi:hypothetical protein
MNRFVAGPDQVQTAGRLTPSPTARALDAQAERDHLSGDAGGLEGETDGLEGWQGHRVG